MNHQFRRRTLGTLFVVVLGFSVRVTHPEKTQLAQSTYGGILRIIRPAVPIVAQYLDLRPSGGWFMVSNKGESVFCEYVEVFGYTINLTAGCDEKPPRPIGDSVPVAATLPREDVVVLLERTGPAELACANSVGSDGKRLTVGRLAPWQADHETGRFYVGVMNTVIGVTSDRSLSIDRTVFSDAEAAVQRATELGATEFHECQFPRM